MDSLHGPLAQECPPRYVTLSGPQHRAQVLNVFPVPHLERSGTLLTCERGTWGAGQEPLHASAPAASAGNCSPRRERHGRLFPRVLSAPVSWPLASPGANLGGVDLFRLYQPTSVGVQRPNALR